MSKKSKNPPPLMIEDPLAWLTEAPGEAPTETSPLAAAELAEPLPESQVEPDFEPVDAPALEEVSRPINEWREDLPPISEPEQPREAKPEPEAAPPAGLVPDSASKAEADGEGWGLFAPRASAAEPAGAASDDEDGAWGLFDAAAGESKAAPVTASRSWGLFAEDEMDLIDFGSTLQLQDVEGIREQLLEKAGGGALLLDAEQLDRVDTAGLQLLCALATSEREHGRALRWRGVSKTLRQGAQDLDLADLLGLAA